MSAEDGYDSDSYVLNNIKSSRDQSQLSRKDMFEEGKEEEKNGKKNRLPKYNSQFIPPVAVPEKIVICIDMTPGVELGYPCTPSTSTVEASTIMQEALRVFFINKLAISKDTEFALVSIKPGNFQILLNFTSNVKHLERALAEMKTETNEEEMPDNAIGLTEIFSSVFSMDLPETHKSKMIPPDFLVRVIFIYNNSCSIPKLNEVEKFHAKFLNSPYFVFDVIYFHDAQSDFNSVVEIYEHLSKIISIHSYFLECSRNVTKVFNYFAKLLAHPYQRVGQDIWEF